MRVYLDNCCYNRPFDVQTQAAVKIESDAKLLIQGLMRTGVLEYAWSFMLRMEASRNPDYQRKRAILDWAIGAAVGDVNAEQFIALVNREPFDYTEWRKENLFVGETADSLMDRADALYGDSYPNRAGAPAPV